MLNVRKYFMVNWGNVYWYSPKPNPVQLDKDLSVDVAIVGGGMAGLSAAQHFLKKGCSVAVLERTFCGSGASGRSSGFITPDSELSLAALVDRFGRKSAQQLWEFACGGVQIIQDNINNLGIECQAFVQDSLIVARSAKHYKIQIKKEHQARHSLGYESTLYTRSTLPAVLGSHAYFGGVSYGNTLSINTFGYLQALKNHLVKSGALIFEETEVESISGSGLRTKNNSVSAKSIIVCTDAFTPSLGRLSREVSCVQTFLLLSAPLSRSTIDALFPKHPFMVWDTDIIYNYYRLTNDYRLLVGGSTIPATYRLGSEQHNQDSMTKKLISYMGEIFPNVRLDFEHMWNGFIGASKDFAPLAGRDKEEPSIFYVAGAAGLPWAAALGRYAAECILDGRDDLDAYFSPYRKFPLPRWTSSVLGKRLSFALSHLIKLKSF